MEKTKQLVILGDSAFAEVAYEYFTHDSPYEVVGFSVETPFLKRERLFGLPVVPFETLGQWFTPRDVEFYAAIVYTQLNRLRTRLFEAAKQQGFRPAGYVSSRASVWHNVELGEHCFVFEDNTIQPFVKLGENVVLWSGNHVGHHSTIRANCFISSHVVISGFCEIGENSFLGVNSTVANNVAIAKDNWIAPAATISKNTQPGELYGAPSAEASRVSALRFFKVKE
ncbi:MAG TPA: acetyltransferase [Pirellulales bacterium]|jgi:sugar O-acyltransferase (sialic acid O-acetyltransferase NeuD family)|nr:acetyltransferase [Pirellulales bacterium]